MTDPRTQLQPNMNNQDYYIQILRDMFPNKRIQAITEAWNQTPERFNGEQRIQEAVDYLVTKAINDLEDDEAEEGAVGYGVNPFSHYEYLLELFPECCPNYLQQLCSEKVGFPLEKFLDILGKDQYPRRQNDPSSVVDQLKVMLPNADPSYLEEKARDLAFKPITHLNAFVQNAIEKEEYPTMQDYIKRKAESEGLKIYTTDFSITKFLEIIPNPAEYFSGRNPLASSETEDKESLSVDKTYALNFLLNKFRYHRTKHIQKIFENCEYNLMLTSMKLERFQVAFMKPRPLVDCDVETKNVDLLQLIAYLTHKNAIKKHIKEKDENYKLAKQEAKLNGFLQTCGCCFDEELIPEECYFCKKGCIFCKDCVRIGAETEIGKNEIRFPCLADCDSEFCLSTLQSVLNPKVFYGLARRIQQAEIKQANLDNMETCAFCDYSAVVDPDVKIFKCLSTDCMKETCRECRHEAHIPLRCNEIEYDEDVKMRTYIEQKMTEALLRQCWKCSRSFIKETGCNKMTCRCGALMCYVCRQPVQNYHHFGDGSDGRCPLWTNDLTSLHFNNVLQGAQQAKEELGLHNNPERLKYDPTKNIQQFKF